MNTGSYVKTMFVGTAIFGPLFFYFLFFTTPQGGLVTRASLLFALFLFILCFLSLILFSIKKKITNNELHFILVKNSTRQALLTALFVISILLLGSFNLLTWWDALLLAFSLLLLELYFKSGRSY